MAPGSFHDPRGLLTGARFWVFIFNAEALDAGSWSGAIYVSETRNLGLGQSLIRQTYETGRDYLLLQTPIPMRREIRRILRTIQQENAVRRVGAVELIKAHLSVLLISLLRLQGTARVEHSAAHVHPTVSEAMSYIDRHYRAGITLADIARRVGRSRAHVTSLIRQHTGKSAIAWLSDRRLHEAKSLILTSSLSIAQIAETLGYRNARHFSEMFRRRFGATPTRWRSRLVTDS
jgi:AraC-like DNA-binding protein